MSVHLSGIKSSESIWPIYYSIWHRHVVWMTTQVPTVSKNLLLKLIFTVEKVILIYSWHLPATLITAAAGTTVGWTSPTLPILLAPDSPIETSRDQSSWIASLMILCSGTAIYQYTEHGLITFLSTKECNTHVDIKI